MAPNTGGLQVVIAVGRFGAGAIDRPETPVANRFA
jgi:hypothetical protein